MKKVLAIMLLALAMGLGTPAVMAAEGTAESPGVKAETTTTGTAESPGVLGTAESPGIMATLIIYLDVIIA